MAWYIGNIKIENKIVIAPMAGVTNLAYREVCKEFGAGLVCAEMVSDKALQHKNEKTWKMLDVSPFEHPISMQIFGGDIDSLVEGAMIIDKNCDADIIDINMGCPVTKVIKSGAGSKLLHDPDKVYEIVKKVVDSVSKPVTVKIRSGWDFDSINAVEVAKNIERAGARAIAIHGRTRSQIYSGKADWDIIKQVKDAVSIPVIGNGDIRSGADALRMIEETGVDAIMIGRGVLGNPWIVKEVSEALKGNNFGKDVSFKVRKKIIMDHIEKLVKLKGEKAACLEMRTHIAWYVKGLRHATVFKRKLNEISTIDDIISLMNEYETVLEGEYNDG